MGRTAAGEAGRRGRGRPRDEALQQRIKDAAMAVLARHGFSGLTLDRLCTEAGVPKATFYRRWDNPTDCVVEGLLAVWGEAEFIDTGAPLRDLEAFAHKLIALYTHPLLGRCMLAVQAERPVNPAVFESVDAAGLQRRARNTAALTNALERLPERPGLSAGVMLHVLNGVARNIEGLRWPMSDDDLRALIVTLLTPAERAGL